MFEETTKVFSSNDIVDINTFISSVENEYFDLNIKFVNGFNILNDRVKISMYNRIMELREIIKLHRPIFAA